ncbi:hypothetical protein [Xenorhabdus taiwanensis]|uniref:Uncharacterized protein n=1 Tax=Xenorhabdus taiwanensis TaxID=3085177 RepID=A0ABN7BY98_9GAMM|nr:hypothetical protein TCT1_02100 [Xenorhabdus sp. TCT-1]
MRYSARSALAGLNDLEASLNKKDRALRKAEFDKAREFIQSAEKGGGVDAQVSKTFLVKGTAHERVDIEVTTGKAFVSDSDTSLGRNCK